MRPSVSALVLLLGVRGVAAQGFTLSEPASAPRREIVETEPGPTYYRLPPQTTHFLSRTALGLQRSGGDSRFSLDLLFGAALRFDRRSYTALWIEGGYGYVAGREHLAMLGLGVGHRRPGLGRPLLAVVPHVIVGTLDGERCLGLRTSAIAGFALYGLELAHQVAFVDGTPVHELHVALTFPFLAGLE